MFSIFSRFRRRREDTTDRGTAEPAPESEGLTTAAVGNAALAFRQNSCPPLGQVITVMLNFLEDYLPDPISSLPRPNVSVNSITEKPLAIGNDRGIDRRGQLGLVALKGGRLDAVVRFQLWANDPNEVENAIQALQSEIIADRNNLRRPDKRSVDEETVEEDEEIVEVEGGFLKVQVVGTSLSEHISSPDSWRKTTDFRVLFEYYYNDTDGAEALIARIPIHSDPELRDSPDRETTVVADEIVRWDDETTPTLEFGASSLPVIVTGLASFVYLPPGSSGNQVTLARLDRNAVIPPTSYPTLADFHSAVTNVENPDRHAQVTFTTVTDFISEFSAVGDLIELGDWDQDDILDPYRAGTLNFDPPIRLSGSNEIFQLAYQDSVLDSKAVVYLRASTNKR